jgi:hypothetical protein
MLIRADSILTRERRAARCRRHAVFTLPRRRDSDAFAAQSAPWRRYACWRDTPPRYGFDVLFAAPPVYAARR